MTISPVPQSLPSSQTVRAKAHIPREPQSPVPVGIGGTGGENCCDAQTSPVISSLGDGLGDSGQSYQLPMVAKQPAPELLQSNNNDEALTFARQLRSRFAECKLTYHAADGVTRGKRPYWWAL